MTFATEKHATKYTRSAFAVVMAAVFFIGVLSLSSAAAKKKEQGLVGFVSSVKGKAFLVRGKRPEIPLEGMDPLRAGDVVGVNENSSVSVNLCAASRKIDVRGGAIFTVARKNLKFAEGKAAGRSTIKKSLCSVLMTSSGKFDRSPSVKDEIGEAIGAMSAMGILSAKSGGDAEGASVQDVLDSMKAREAREEALKRDREAAERSMASASRGSAYDVPPGDTGYDVSAPGPTGYGSDGVPSAMPSAPAWDSGTSYSASSGGGGGGYGPSSVPSAPVITEEKIYKPEVEYINPYENLEEKEVLDRPDISWYFLLDAEKYVIKIYNSLSIEIFSAESETPYFIYPDTAPPLLRGGWYLCEVITYAYGGLEADYQTFGLSIMGDDMHELYESEKKALVEIVEADPSNPDVYILLGRFYESAGTPSRAVEAYEKALDLQPNNPALRERLDSLKTGY